MFNYVYLNIIAKSTNKNQLLPKGIKIFPNGRIEVFVMKSPALPHQHNPDRFSASIVNELSNIEKFREITDIFRQLSDTTRIRLFWLLCHCEECVMNISVMLDMSSPAVSHHLRLLRNSGLIISRRSGKEVYYHAAETEQSRLLHNMIEQVLKLTCPN